MTSNEPRVAARLLNLMAAALAERKIILHSSDLSLMVPVVEALDALLYPMKWAHAFIPVLPRTMLSHRSTTTVYYWRAHGLDCGTFGYEENIAEGGAGYRISLLRWRNQVR